MALAEIDLREIKLTNMKGTKILFLSLIVLGNYSCNKSSDSYDLIITNVNLIDGTSSPLQENVNVYVNNDKIVAIDKSAVSQQENLIDGTGKYLIPGLFDCHVHTDDYQKDFPRFMHYGVTSVFVVGGSKCTNEYYAEMRKMGGQNSLPAPRVFHTSQHFTMEGRHPVKTYAGRWEDGKTVFLLKDTVQIERLVEEVSQFPIVGIKLTIEDGPHPPWVKRMPQAFVNKVRKEASKNGIEVFAHVSDNIELEIALDAGIQNLVHWTGVDIDFERDTLLLEKIYQVKPSWITTLMIDKGFLYPLFPEWVETVRQENVFDEEDLAKANDSSYIARAQDIIGFWKSHLKQNEITLKDIAEFQVKDIKELYEKGINFALGTDIGTFVLPGYSLHEEMHLMQMGGMKPLDILKMGTLNAATLVHAEDSLGSIEVGKLADMILLNENPLEDIQNSRSISEIFKNGRPQNRIIKQQ